MRNALRSALAVAIVSTVTAGLVAQTPSSSAPQSSAAKQVTFSGCIEKAPSDSSAAASTTTASTATPAFILTNASPAGTGTVGTAGSAKPAAKYRLDADAAKLSPHVGHKVEVTGTVDESSSASPATSTTTSTPSSSAGMDPKFNVESVKMVAATCS